MSDDKEKISLDELNSSEDFELSSDESDADDMSWMNESPTDDVGQGPIEQLEAIYNVPVQISVVLGKATMPISQLIKLGRGAVLELDRKVGESVDIVVNNRLIAKGEVVVMDDRVGITMTEIIRNQE